MQIDFSRPLVDFRGVPIPESGGGQPLSPKTVACNALASVLDGDAKSSITVKLSREDLCRRVWEGATEVSIEDLAMLKERINIAYASAVLVAAAVRALEGHDDPAGVSESAPS